MTLPSPSPVVVHPEAQRALAFAEGVGNAGPATVIGAETTAHWLDAVLANAVMMRALRQEDRSFRRSCIRAPLTIPLALAVGEVCGSSGREVMTAVVAGYDVIGRMAGSVWSWERGYRTLSHVYGAVGPAAVATKLLGLDAEQTAIAYAANLGAMITDGFDNHQYGVVARNGLTAAYLGMAHAPAHNLVVALRARGGADRR